MGSRGGWSHFLGLGMMTINVGASSISFVFGIARMDRNAFDSLQLSAQWYEEEARDAATQVRDQQHGRSELPLALGALPTPPRPPHVPAMIQPCSSCPSLQDQARVHRRGWRPELGHDKISNTQLSTRRPFGKLRKLDIATTKLRFKQGKVQRVGRMYLHGVVNVKASSPLLVTGFPTRQHVRTPEC